MSETFFKLLAVLILGVLPSLGWSGQSKVFEDVIFSALLGSYIEKTDSHFCAPYLKIEACTSDFFADKNPCLIISTQTENPNGDRQLVTNWYLTHINKEEQKRHDSCPTAGPEIPYCTQTTITNSSWLSLTDSEFDGQLSHIYSVFRRSPTLGHFRSDQLKLDISFSTERIRFYRSLVSSDNDERIESCVYQAEF